MIGPLRQLFKPRYETFNRLEIISGSLLHNLAYLKSLQPAAEIFPVLKSNAYGHGLREVCGILAQGGAKMVSVDSYPEAQIVYDYFPGKVLILGEMPAGAYRYTRLERTEFVVYTPQALRILSRYGKKASVHLFANTGMNREGIKDIGGFLAANQDLLNKVEVTGFCSHLASADEDSVLNSRQEEKFLAGLDLVRRAGFFPRWVHLGNSAGLFRLHNEAYTAFRPGISFYGYSPFAYPDPATVPLRPALRLYSQLIATQELEEGDSVSYNETYRAAAPTRIGVLPFGYYEGLDRRLSNRARLGLVTDEGISYCRLAGRVCMNISSIDLGNNLANIGNNIEIISDNHEAPNSVSNLASIGDSSIYELLVRLQGNIRREVL